MDGSDPARIEQGDWPTRIDVSDKCMLGFPTSKAHYQVDVHWKAGRSTEGDEWGDAVHSFWCRWSHAEALAKEVEMVLHETTKEAQAKGFPAPEPLSFALPSKWWGDRGDVKEIGKRMGELGTYLRALCDWGASLEPDTALWDRVRLTGPLKVFLCQQNTTGHPTGGTTVTDIMFSAAPSPVPRTTARTKTLAPSAAASPSTPMDRRPGTKSGAKKPSPQLRAVTATYLFSTIKAVLEDLNLPDTEEDEESAAIVVDQDLLLYKNAGPSAAPTGSVAAKVYEWIGISATSYPQEVLAAIASPGDGKFHAYGAGRYAIHVGSPDFRAAAYAACSQNEAEAFLAEVYVSVLRQFIIAVSELQETSRHKLRMPPVANGDYAGRFAASLGAMSYNAVDLALSQLSSAERARLAFQGVEILLCVGTDPTELELFADAGFTATANKSEPAAGSTPVASVSVDESVEASTGLNVAGVDSSVETTVPVASSVDSVATSSPTDAVAALAEGATQQGLEDSSEAAAMASLGLDASVEVDTLVTDTVVPTNTDDDDVATGVLVSAKVHEDEDDDALLARMLGGSLSDAAGDGGFAAGEMSISVGAPVDVAADEEDWIE